MTNVGDKFILWRTKYDNVAYTDQMGIGHGGYVVLQEYHVTVIEKHNHSRDMWTDEKRWEGVKAESESGLIFYRHWDVFPSDSMTPTYFWDVLEDDVNGIWQPVDAVQAANWKHIIYVKDGKRAVPEAPWVLYCERHQEYRSEGICYICHFEEIRRKREKRI